MIISENTKLSKQDCFQNYEKAEIGTARYVYRIESEKDDTPEFWNYLSSFAEEKSLPIKILGSGTNLLITSDYFDGIIVKVDYTDAQATINETSIIVGAGASLDKLVNQVAEHGYDMSVLAGIPGTVGGAIYGNAGSSIWKRNIGEITKRIEFYDFHKHEMLWLDLDKDISFFSWRTNRLKEETKNHSKYFIRTVELVPPKDDVLVIKQKIQDRYRARLVSDTEGWGTAGSFFASALLPERLQSIIKEKTLVRDLVVNCPVLGDESKKLSDLNFNGAHFTPTMAFLKTTKETTDRDIAKLLDITVKSLKKAYDFVPTKEVDLIGEQGSYTLEEFIQRKIMP